MSQPHYLMAFFTLIFSLKSQKEEVLKVNHNQNQHHEEEKTVMIIFLLSEMKTQTAAFYCTEQDTTCYKGGRASEHPDSDFFLSVKLLCEIKKACFETASWQTGFIELESISVIDRPPHRPPRVCLTGPPC